MEHFKGFGLFNDVEDASMQAFNRGRMMVNIVMDHSKDGKFNMKGVALSTGYMNAIPKGERRAALEEFIRLLQKEGFRLGGNPEVAARAMEEAING